MSINYFINGMKDISTVEGLRYYQKDALKNVISAIEKGLDGNYLLVLPTAAGKSFLVSSMAHIINKPVLILQPTKEILQQNYEKLLKYVDSKDIGIYSASMNEKTIRMFTFATIQSVYKKADFFKHFDYFILDESHYLNPSNLTGMFTTFINGINKLRKELMRRPPIKIIGLTATPYRMETAYKFDKKENEIIAYTTIKLINRMKGRFWKHLLYNINMQELMDEGFLCPLYYMDKTLIEHENIPLNKSMSDFNLEMYEKKISKKQEEIIKIIHYAESISNGVLVFCSSVSQAEILSAKIKESVVVTAKTKAEERDSIVKRFKSGEIKTVLNVGVFTCLSDDTEILTSNNSWVGINNVDKNDKIAQFEKGKITFSKPIAIHKKKLGNNTMIGLDGRYVSVSVTNDHDLLVGKYKKGKNNKYSIGKFEKAKAETMIDKKFYLPVSGIATPQNITVEQEPKPSRRKFLASNSFNYRKKGLSHAEAKILSLKMYDKACAKKYKNPNELTLDECRFIGFWIGDGSKNNLKNGGNCDYSLCQSFGTPKMILWINKLLKNCNIDYSYNDYPSNNNAIINGRSCKASGHRIYRLSKGTGGHKQERNGLYKLIPYLEKKGTKLFWGLNKNQYFSLMEGLWKADGWHGDNKKYFGGKITGEYKKLFDLLQSIGVCRGFRITIKPIKKRIFNKKQLYNISLFDKKIHQLSNDRLKKIPYKKARMVWCVTMPKGTIVTRRKGTVTIMGNCGFDHPALDCIVLLRPTRSIGLLLQMLGRGVRIAPGKKDCKIIDMTSTVKNIGRIETVKLEKKDVWELTSEKGSWHNKEIYRFKLSKKETP
jgi:DNA repair protein RadD